MPRESIARVFLAGTLVFSAALAAEDKPPLESKQQIESIVRQYILDHPEVVMESVRVFQQRQQAAERERSRNLIKTRSPDLMSDATAPVMGKPDAPVTIVEFFDYHCGYCRRVYPTLVKLVADNPGVRVVFKEFPILGAESGLAARAALAAQLQGAYLPFHRELMSTSEPLTVEAMQRIAQKLGLDGARLKADMDSPAIAQAIARNQELGIAVGVDATPAFVIDSELISGAFDVAAVQALVQKAGVAGKAKQTGTP